MAVKGALQLRVVSPGEEIFQGDCRSLTLPAWDGRMGVLPGHAAFLGLLGSGMLQITSVDGSSREFYLAGGVVKVEGDRVTVLSEFAAPEPPAAVDRASVMLDPSEMEADSEVDLEAMSTPGNPLV